MFYSPRALRQSISFLFRRIRKLRIGGSLAAHPTQSGEFFGHRVRGDPMCGSIGMRIEGLRPPRMWIRVYRRQQATEVEEGEIPASRSSSDHTNGRAFLSYAVYGLRYNSQKYNTVAEKIEGRGYFTHSEPDPNRPSKRSTNPAMLQEQPAARTRATLLA